MNTKPDLTQLTGRPKNKLMQLCLPVARLRPSANDFEKRNYILMTKYDGVFCLALKQKNKVTIYSRTGEIYTSMGHIEAELEKYLRDDHIVIFEAMAQGKQIPQATVSGWCRDTKNQHINVVAMCHTYLGLSDFIGETQTDFQYLESDFQLRFKGAKGCVQVVSHYGRVKSLAQALQIADKKMATGAEGVILKDLSAYYEGGKRNATFVKIKEKVTYDLQVVDIFEGTGKYKGHLGGVICRWKDEKTLRVGSGFDDARRWDYFKNPDLILGQIVEVEAMKESSKGLLREPRFKSVRFDKTEGDF